MSDLYQELIIEHAQHPQNVGTLPGADVAEHDCVNASCGDALTVQVQMADGVVQLVKWHGQGCAISQAAASMMSVKMTGEPVESILQWELETVLQEMGLETISPGRIKCALLFLSCVQKALL